MLKIPCLLYNQASERKMGFYRQASIFTAAFFFLQNQGMLVHMQIRKADHSLRRLGKYFVI